MVLLVTDVPVRVVLVVTVVLLVPVVLTTLVLLLEAVAVHEILLLAVVVVMIKPRQMYFSPWGPSRSPSRTKLGSPPPEKITTPFGSL